MVAFRTQVMAVMTGLVVATGLALGAVLISAWTDMLHRQTEGAGRGIASLLAAQLEQQRALVDKLLGPRPSSGPPPAQAPPPPGRDNPAGTRAADVAPGQSFEASLQELADVVRAQRIALVAEGRVIVSASSKGVSTGDVSDAQILALRKRLEAAPPGSTEVLETATSVAVMTMLKSPDPTGGTPGLLVQLPKALASDLAGASPALLSLTAIMVVGVAVAAAWYLSRSMSKPLLRLALAARTYGEGALDEPAPVAGPAETRRLGLVLNSMATSLKQHIENLEVETRRREKLESELRVAADLQRSLLPRPGLQRFGSVEVLGWSEAAEAVGGDFYDFRLVNPDTLAFIIGDATGKGMPAALLAGKCLSVLQALTEAEDEPGELLRHANKLLWEQFRGQGRFVTAFLGIVDLAGGRLFHACAGHNRPYFSDEALGTPVQLANREGLPLGVTDGSTFDTAVREWKPGDTLLLYTDGITETPDAEGTLFGEDRLEQLFAQHANEALPELLNVITDGVRQHSTEWPASDDCTVLLLRNC